MIAKINCCLILTFLQIAANHLTAATILPVIAGKPVTGEAVCHQKTPVHCKTLPRRYDVNDVGYREMFHGWADVQGQGAAHDYCRMVGNKPNIFLSCALAGTQGESDSNYLSATVGFDTGYANTWYMKDEDGDGRDDYCRCVGVGETQMVVCTRAGPKGFYGSAEQGGRTFSFSPTGPIHCEKRQVRPESGRADGFI